MTAFQARMLLINFICHNIPRISQPLLFVLTENIRFKMFGGAITIKRTIKFLNYTFTRVY